MRTIGYVTMRRSAATGLPLEAVRVEVVVEAVFRVSRVALHLRRLVQSVQTSKTSAAYFFFNNFERFIYYKKIYLPC